MTRAVANRYVAALADVVMEAGSGLGPEAVLEQLEAFGACLARSRDLQVVLQSPAVLPADKRVLVGDLSERLGLARTVQNFIHVVVDHRRIGHFALLVEGFEAWLDRHRNRVRLEVRVAFPLGPAQRGMLEQRFGSLTGQRVRAAYQVDPGLLGGSVVQVGSTLYDGSLLTGLRGLEQTLAGER